MALTEPAATDRPLSVLIFTPTPTHPPIQGNRQRVFDICRALRSIGVKLTVLYYATESIAAGEARRMREAWGDVRIVFPRGVVHKHSLVRYPAIDDWYDESITQEVQKLCAERNFDVCIVNYVWYSKLFEALPSSVVRVIDTHDVFGGRSERFAEIGLTPEWFHTSVVQEGLGLDRSDFVLAIQSAERDPLQARTSARVRTLGFLSTPNFLPAPVQTKSGPLRAGYIGSGNPFNIASMLAFAAAVNASPSLMQQVEFHIAGHICVALKGARHPFLLHGTTESVGAFYESIDVAINPMAGGTGLKIKSLEALSFGMPLVATADAMTGIPSAHPGHQLASPAETANWLIALAQDPSRLVEEAELSRRVFLDYRRSQLDAFRTIWSEISAEVPSRVRQHDDSLLENYA
jgi:hypothetical protein